MHHPSAWPLAWMACTWSCAFLDYARLEQLWHTGDWLLHFAMMLKYNKGPVRRAVATQRIYRALLARSLLPTRRITCSVPMACLIAVCKRYVMSLLRENTPG
eukprot:7224550-Alexandrium_andersonii.AAC.1